MIRASILLAALALAGCASQPGPAPDRPKTITEVAPVPVSCVAAAFPHMPAIPDGPSLKRMPDFASRDAAVKAAWPSLAAWAIDAERQINLCRNVQPPARTDGR